VQSDEWGRLDQQVMSLHQRSDHLRATKLALKALGLADRKMGPTHPDVALSLNNLAELYRAQAHYAEAELLYRRSLRIWEKVLGPDHPNMATALENYAKPLRATERESHASRIVRPIEIRVVNAIMRFLNFGKGGNSHGYEDICFTIRVSRISFRTYGKRAAASGIAGINSQIS
jgi:tetratricopeptide (TPR) repeat protein